MKQWKRVRYSPFAVVVGRQGWRLDAVPLKLWFLIIGVVLMFLGLIPDGILIALGVASIIIGVIMYIRGV